MEPTTISVAAAASVAVGGISISTFAVGVTQLVKDLGVQGQILKLVCILAATVAWGVMALYPQAWAEISVLLIALSSTGVVSFGDERLQRMKSVR